MSVGLRLAGRWQREERSLETVQAWFEESCADMLGEEGAWIDDEGTLRLSLHPAAEQVAVAAAPGSLEVSASTGPVGPGYYAWLCETLDDLGAALGLAWETPDDDGDETGYFHTRDDAELERQFLLWQGTVARHVRDHMLGDGGAVHLSMPMDGPTYEVEGAVLTPLGPRDAAWVRAVAEDARRGRDFFSWWERGRDAPFLLGRALYRMWHEICWREPLDDDDSYLLDDVLTDLERAYAMGPTLAYPWREWRELNGYTHAMFGTDHDLDDDLVAEVVRRAQGVPATTPLVGYRRGALRLRAAADWSVRVPGAFKETREEDGTWLCYDESRTVRMTGFRAKDPKRMPEFDPPGPAEEVMDCRDGPLRARLAVSMDEEREYFVATGEAAVPGRMAAVTLAWKDPAHRAWAEETLRSIR